MCEYPYTTEKLSSLNDKFVLYGTGERPNAASVVESCDRLIHEFEDIKRKVLIKGTINDRKAFEECIACLEDVRGKLKATAVLNQGYSALLRFG